MTKVDRKTHCFIGCSVIWERKNDNMQKIVDQGSMVHQYYMDAFPTYVCLIYFLGEYQVTLGKMDTYLAEEDNAELRHYLARLARKASCFPRCPYALCHALRLTFFYLQLKEIVLTTLSQLSRTYI